MTKEQLKQSLDQLSPSEEQRQQMLRNIRQAKPEKKTPIFWKLASALAVMVLLFGIAKVLPAFAPTASEEMTMRSAEEPATTMMAPNEMAAADAQVSFAWKDYDEELANTPWREDFQGPLPIYRMSSELTSGSPKQEEASAPENKPASDLLDYAYKDSLSTSGYTLGEMTDIISFDQAKDRLVELTGIKKSDIVDGFLSYTPIDSGETELVPTYRFRYQFEGSVNYLNIDARP